MISKGFFIQRFGIIIEGELVFILATEWVHLYFEANVHKEKTHNFIDDFSFTNQKEIDSIAYADRMRQGHLKKKDEAQLSR